MPGDEDAEAVSGDAGKEGQAKAAPEGKSGPVVVGIGSSAGGYEATKELFGALSSGTGMAFVVVPHLAPSHESHLADLLRRDTKMTVQEATDGVSVEPDHVYVIAPNTTMVIDDGTLRVHKRLEGHDRVTHVIDRFFQSLAESYGDRAVGVVLSGALTDGSDGIRAIKAAGGFALAQEPATAAYPEMPRGAIRAAVMDVIGSPTELAAALKDLVGHLHRPLPALKPEAEKPEKDSVEQAVLKILEAVERYTGTDFRGYKRSTLLRRIQRRMIATKHFDLHKYEQLVAKSAEEAEHLHQEILILVTKFFRDPETTKVIQEEILPGIFKNRPYNEPVRIWVAGCSTGQEAYSLVMLVTEYTERHNIQGQLSIFATDLSAAAIAIAREGVYPDSVADEVSEERLARFFEPYGNGYRIRKHIRGMCVFAEHNLVQDPPFSNIDIASCRNVLVYMNSKLQRRALEAFHYSLKADGYMILGNAESVGRNTDLFSALPEARNIGRPREDTTGRVHGYLLHRQGFAGAPEEKPRGAEPTIEGIDKEADQVLLDRYAPPGVVVDQTLRIVHFRGQTERFLSHRPGPANLDLLELVPDSLALRIREAVRATDAKRTQLRRGNVTFQVDGRTVTVALDVVPIVRKGSREKYFLITFNERRDRLRRAAPSPGRRGLLDIFIGPGRKELETQLERLHLEVKEAREHLKHVTTDHSAAIEELRSANEETVSTNEELQSTNEELQTTKEELQSTNEELTTLNEELHLRNKELQDTNNDLGNLLQSVDLPVIMLGADLRIRRFTERSHELFHLISTDVNRPLTDMHAKFNTKELKEDILSVFKNYQRVDRTVKTDDGRRWRITIHPFRTSENQVEGVVLVGTELNH